MYRNPLIRGSIKTGKGSSTLHIVRTSGARRGSLRDGQPVEGSCEWVVQCGRGSGCMGTWPKSESKVESLERIRGRLGGSCCGRRRLGKAAAITQHLGRLFLHRRHRLLRPRRLLRQSRFLRCRRFFRRREAHLCRLLSEAGGGTVRLAAGFGGFTERCSPAPRGPARAVRVPEAASPRPRPMTTLPTLPSVRSP